MHQSVHDFVESVITADDVAGKRVLEVGSYDVNGSVRPFIESLCPAKYLGVDMRFGPGVDVVCDGVDLARTVGTNWDVVISTEMLEHAQHWKKCLTQMTTCTKVSGTLLITARGPGFPLHDFPGDHWRFTDDVMQESFQRLGVSGYVISDPECPGVLAFGVRMLFIIGSLHGIMAERAPTA